MDIKNQIRLVVDVLEQLDEQGVYGWYPAGRRAQMLPSMLYELFPEGPFEYEHQEVWGKTVGVYVHADNVEYFTMTTPERWKEISGHEVV